MAWAKSTTNARVGFFWKIPLQFVDTQVRAAIRIWLQIAAEKTLKIPMTPSLTKAARIFSAFALVIGALLTTSFQASAVLPFTMSTNATSVITGGSWVGNGAVQPNVSTTTFVTPNVDADVLVNDFTNGSLTINPANLFPEPRINAATGVTHSVAVTGGTADFRIANSNNFDLAGARYNAVGLQGFSGNVTKFVWTMQYTLPMAGRNDSTTEKITRPLGAAFGLVATGSGLALTDFKVQLQLGGVSSASSSNGTFTPGVPSNAIPWASDGWDSPAAAGATSFVSNDGFLGLIDLLTLGSGANFLMVKGYDVNGSGNGYQSADADLVYATTLTFTVEAAAGKTFQSGTIFTISMDGQQYANVNNAIPEPTAGVLLGLAAIGSLVGWRGRRAS